MHKLLKQVTARLSKIVAKTFKQLDDCSRNELRIAAKQAGLGGQDIRFADYINGTGNQTPEFDRKVITALKARGHKQVCYERPFWMTVQ